MKPNSSNLQRLVDFFEKQSDSEDYSFFEPEDFIQIIDYYTSINKIGLALNASRLSLRHFPYHIDLLFKRAELLYEEAEFDHALDILDKIVMIDPFNPDVRLFQAKVLFEAGDIDEALEHLDYILNTQPDNPEAIRLKALLHFDSGEDEQAYHYFKKYLIHFPEDSDLVEDFYICAVNINREDDLTAFFKKLLERHPYSPKVWYNAGLIYEMKGFIPEAIDTFEVAIALQADIPEPYYHIGNFNLSEQKYAEALHNFLKAKEFGFDEASILPPIGFCYFYLENDLLAEQYFNESISKDKDSDMAVYGLSLIAHKNKMYNKAIQLIRKAVKLNPLNFRYRLFYAICLGDTGKWKDSESVFLQMINDKTEEIGLLVDYLLYRYELGHKIKTIELARKVYEKNINDPLISYFFSGLLYENGFIEESRIILHKILKKRFKDHFILFNYFPHLNSNLLINKIIDEHRTNKS